KYRQTAAECYEAARILSSVREKATRAHLPDFRRKFMKIHFLTSAHNSLSQRLLIERTERRFASALRARRAAGRANLSPRATADVARRAVHFCKVDRKKGRNLPPASSSQ